MTRPAERNQLVERNETVPQTRSGTLLDRFAREYGDASERQRYGLLVSIGDAEKAYLVQALGLARERRSLIVTAPENDSRELIAVMKGQTLTCRWFNATTAFRFRVTIAKLAFEPLPLLYLDLPEHVEHSEVRQLPRALANVRALLRAPFPTEAIVVDLSLGGARVGVVDQLPLEKGGTAELLMWPKMLGRDFLLRLDCTVSGVLGRTERKHPEIFFYGLSFNEVAEREQLALHAYVQTCLATEFDWLTRALGKSR